MAEGGHSQASLKKELDDISRQIYEIDLKTQSFGPNNSHIPALKQAKLELQKRIVPLQVQLEILLSRRKKARRYVGIFSQGGLG